MNNKSIVLIGFMGVGKTTLGEELAKKLDWPFLDIDEEIEKIYEMKTVDIFKVHGEKAFRKTEKDLIIEACKQDGKIISVGGGAFMNDETRHACMTYANVFYLNLSWDQWKDRIHLLIDTRPILQNKTLDEIKDLFIERQEIYKEHHANITLDNLEIEEAVEKIIDVHKELAKESSNQ